jgi:hypothetical protein
MHVSSPAIVLLSFNRVSTISDQQVPVFSVFEHFPISYKLWLLEIFLISNYISSASLFLHMPKKKSRYFSILRPLLKSNTLSATKINTYLDYHIDHMKFRCFNFLKQNFLLSLCHKNSISPISSCCRHALPLLWTPYSFTLSPFRRWTYLWYGTHTDLRDWTQQCWWSVNY